MPSQVLILLKMVLEKYVPKNLYFVLLWSITNVRNARKTFAAFK